MDDPLPYSFLTVHIAQISTLSWFIVVLCLATIGFFSGMEIAFISANKLRIELKSKKGVVGGKWIGQYLKKPDEFITTVLVATNLALVIYGIAMGDILHYYLSFLFDNELLNFIITTVLSTLVVLVTAEFIPKTIFKAKADRFLFLFAIPFKLSNIILWPFITFTRSLSTAFLKGDKLEEGNKVFSRVDLDNFIATIESTGDVENQEIDTEAFRNALDFSEIIVRDFMIPRTEIVALKMESSINELKNTFIDTSLSRILIYKDNVENIIGFVHHSDLFDSPEKIHEILHPVIIVSETLEAHELLKKFIHERKSMAVVVDEFGGVAGIATLEDIVEEIFGEIKDEFDNEDGKEMEIGPNHYRLSARLEIDYLNEKYNFNLDEGEYNTLGGFIIYFAERIPQVDEIIRYENLEFTIKSMEGARILEVDLKIYQ